VSAVSVWEIAIKETIGKLHLPLPVGHSIVGLGFVPLSMTPEHADAAGRLPLHHRDLFDRMLVAQAQLEGLTIVTRDRSIGLYDVATMPA